jgi:hypothetical protein
MMGQVGQRTPPVGRPKLADALQQALNSHFGSPCRIAALHRRPYVYSTSFQLEELEVVVQDGADLHLVFKDLSRSGMSAGARAAKPRFLYEPLREIDTYRNVLSGAALGTAVCYGAVVDVGREGLFLEKVPGRELYQVGDAAVWADVARWLAGMHDTFACRVEEVRQQNPHLLRYDRDFYGRWLHRAQVRLDRGDVPAAQRAAVSRVAAGLDGVTECLAEMPVTLLHGELYASNVLVGDEVTDQRVCAVDWEMAGTGPGLIDLAALCFGWDETNRRAIASAYRAALAPVPGWPPDEDDIMTLLDCSSLCLAVQWLGWSPGWTPPPEHARDWLGQAVQLVERLGS